MKLFALIICLCTLSVHSFAQKKSNQIDSLINAEHQLGHFNGNILVVNNGKIINQINKGYANFQFKVPINQQTKFPIASVTKLFTSIVILQLFEESKINFDDKVSKYITDLPEDCQHILISDLLLHSSKLANEPIKAYLSKYSLENYLKNFLHKKTPADTLQFNYNNVDYILLSRVIEKITGKSFQEIMISKIINPLAMKNTGFVNEDDIIPNLAYGYHNYTFGKGKPSDKLENDSRFISNYYGAGALYSTTDDLYLLLKALKTDKLISAQTRKKYLITAQKNIFVDWLQGSPTYGFFLDKTNAPILRRSGNIDGFNSLIVTDPDFNRMVIILTNTDTSDLKTVGDRVFGLIK